MIIARHRLEIIGDGGTIRRRGIVEVGRLDRLRALRMVSLRRELRDQGVEWFLQVRVKVHNVRAGQGAIPGVRVEALDELADAVLVNPQNLRALLGLVLQVLKRLAVGFLRVFRNLR